MIIAALYTIAQTWKQPSCPSVGECIKIMWSIYTTEYYPTSRKKEILPLVTTREMPERERHILYLEPLTCCSRKTELV